MAHRSTEMLRRYSAASLQQRRHEAWRTRTGEPLPIHPRLLPPKDIDDPLEDRDDDDGIEDDY